MCYFCHGLKPSVSDVNCRQTYSSLACPSVWASLPLPSPGRRTCKRTTGLIVGENNLIGILRAHWEEEGEAKKQTILLIGCLSVTVTRGSESQRGVNNPKYFADVIYGWSLSMTLYETGNEERGEVGSFESIKYDLLVAHAKKVEQNAWSSRRRRRQCPRRRRRSHDVVFEQGPKDAGSATRLRLQSSAGKSGGPGAAAELQYFRQLEKCPAGCTSLIAFLFALAV